MFRCSKHIFSFLLCFAIVSFTHAQDNDTTYYSDTTIETSVGVVPTEEADKNLLDSNITLPSIDPRTVPDTAIERLKKDDAFWYVNTLPKRAKEKTERPSKGILFSKWFGDLMWVLIIICFVAALIWFLASSNIQLFRKRSSAITSIEQEEISEDIFAIDYDKEIRKAVDNKNFSLAIRLHYLQLLLMLSNKGLIHYTHEKTNNEYVSELYKTNYYKDFFRLTRHFEYVWYGQFPISENAFELMQKEFVQFKQRIA
jgi:hypothetical protein